MMADALMALGWAVFSFLWQGLVIGALCAAVLRLVPRSSSAARYAVAGGGLAVGFSVFCATALLSAPSAAQSGSLDDLLASAGYLQGELGAALALVPRASHAEAASHAWIPAVAWLWVIGALWMTLRLTRSCGAAHRLRVRSRIQVEGHVQALADRLCVDLGIRRRVRVFATEIADSPLVVGWLRPVVLVPTATFLVLSAEQLRSVLAHELAHIRRFDPLFNVLQAVVEVLLFFHPVTWWLSSVVRQEREHCCDLAAVRVTGGPLPLARALTRLESHRQSSSEMVLAARPKPGFLMTRIQRILDVGASSSPKRASLRPVTLLGTVALALGLGIASAAANPRPEPSAATVLSLEGRDADGDYAIVEARVLQAVEMGTLSAADAKTVLEALRMSMFSGRHAASQRVKPMSPVIGMKIRSRSAAVLGQLVETSEKLEKLEAELIEVQRAGKAIQEEAMDNVRIIEGRALDGRGRLQQGKDSNRRTRTSEVVELNLKGAVAAGKLSKEQAMEKFNAVRRKAEANKMVIEEQRVILEEYQEILERRIKPKRKLKAADKMIGREIVETQPMEIVELERLERIVEERVRALSSVARRLNREVSELPPAPTITEDPRRGVRGEDVVPGKKRGTKKAKEKSQRRGGKKPDKGSKDNRRRDVVLEGALRQAGVREGQPVLIEANPVVIEAKSFRR